MSRRDSPAGRPRSAGGSWLSAWFRPTLRVRLTLLYGGLFLIAGVALVLVTYALVAATLDSQRPEAVTLAELPADAVPAPLADGRIRVLTPDQAHRVREDLRAQQDEAWDNTVEATLDSLTSRALVALGVVGVIAVGFGWMMAGRVLRPLHRITDTARRVADRSLHERIALRGPDDELKELADTFDAMLERLDRSFGSQQRFVANASHELKTPLAINRTLIEVALADPDASADLRQLGRTLLTTNQRSERLIDGLLLLARSEYELTSRRPVDLAQVARHVVDQTAAEARSASVTVTTELDPARTSGDPVLLERLVLNLVRNAIRHNGPGGSAGVRTGQGGHAWLVVTNTGPAVPPYEVEGLFEPFHRLDDERVASDRGAGLGLSIVRSVARAHGGGAYAEPRRGGGLVVRVGLPLAPASSRPQASAMTAGGTGR